MFLKVAFILFFLTQFSLSTNVSQCHDSEIIFENLADRVKLGTCIKTPCKLKKNTVIPMSLKLSPDRDIEKVTTSVYAIISGVPAPFVGYDRVDACPNIYNSGGETKVGCPLKKGETYLYKTSIEVLQIFPQLRLVVHWALLDPAGKYLLCFETPARITN